MAYVSERRPSSGTRPPAGFRWRLAGPLMALLLAALPTTLLPPEAAGQATETEYEGSVALGLILRQLGTSKRVLMIAAHPDDETTQVLSTLALKEGASVAYLSLTRGEGGQNGIGPELQEALGLLRTEELLAARRIDGARQYFTRAIDWGFSKNAAEAFGHWPREDLLGDVVAVVRHFRPDAIVSVFSGTPRDGHGQHQAAGIVATEAFAAAADPARFPDHAAEGLPAHTAVHLYQIVRGVDEVRAAQLATGDLDPLLGLSHYQVAMASRSRHRSQDMGRLLTPGPQITPLSLVASRAPAESSASLFASVDTTLTLRAAGSAFGSPAATAAVAELLARYEAVVARLRASYNPLYPERLVAPLASASALLAEASDLLRREGGPAEPLLFQLDDERLELAEALRRAARVSFDAISDDETVVPGQTFGLDLVVWNGGSEPVRLERLAPRLPDGWSYAGDEAAPAVIEAGSMQTRRFEVSVPTGAPPTEAYFLRLPREGARYRWPAEAGPAGFPFQADEVAAEVILEIGGVETTVTASATYQGLDPRRGEFRRPVRVVPAIAVLVDSRLAVLPIAQAGRPLRVGVRVSAEEPGGISGTLRLQAPTGWLVDPAEVEIRFAEAGQERVHEFTVRAPRDPEPGRVALAVSFEDERGRRFDRGYSLVEYEHIRPRPLFQPATLMVHAMDVEIASGTRVGYVAAPGDNVPLALEQLGLDIALLGPDELAAAPLDGFDAIVIGIRAYEGRPDLVTHNERLLDYVRRGGTMIVQYNQYQYTEPGIAPHPIAMARPHDRVTDHEADVTVLEPEHPLFSTPNRITAADFDGWVQERGLYFLNRWDDSFQPLLEMADPGEAPSRGSLLITRYGEGTYVYTGLALFRQLPAGVPGAYRLFANMLALGAR